MKNIKKILLVIFMLCFLLACSYNGEEEDRGDKFIDDGIFELEPDSIFEEDRVDDLYLPLVVAHRGYSSQHPENTMEAFIAARDSGADMIELDVQLTKDNVLVIFHDINMSRIYKLDAKISDYSYEELMEISEGNIPTLRQVLEMAREANLGIDIELKSITDLAGLDSQMEKWFVNEVVDEVNEYNMKDNVIFSSFNYNYLMQIELRNSGYRTFYITQTDTIDTLVNICKTDGVAIYYGLLTDGAVDRIHESGKECYIWTVDEEVLMRFVRNQGVDGIITDDVGLARILI